MTTGLELIARIRLDLSTVQRAAVQIDEDIRVVSPAELSEWLGRMQFLDDPQTSRGDINPRGMVHRFQIWTESEIWYVDGSEGYARLTSLPRTPELWVAAKQEWLDFQHMPAAGPGVA